MSNDVEVLRKAMEGWGTDEATLIKVIANRTNRQRQEIKAQYKSTYGRDLIEDLKKETHGKLEDAFVALFTDPIEYDADALRGAMKGAGTNEDTLIEIISSRSPQQMNAVKACYQKKYSRDLEADVKKETSGTLQKILITLLQGKRSVNTKPNQAQCAQIAKEIFDAGEAKMGTDESVFNKYFGSLSPYELACVAQHYHKLTGHTILDAIDKEMHGDSKKAYRTIVYATLSPSEYFATRVNDAIKGFGTNDHLLMRILITRDEIDMPQIKQYYKQLYGKDMVTAIKNDISGDYQKLMVELCDH
jgi:protein required for attachment to host cells